MFYAALTPDQANILVEHSGQAQLADFGFFAIIKDLESARGTLRPNNPTAMWMALEILHKKEYSKKSDVFAFGMVTIEVRTDDAICWVLYNLVSI